MPLFVGGAQPSSHVGQRVWCAYSMPTLHKIILSKSPATHLAGEKQWVLTQRREETKLSKLPKNTIGVSYAGQASTRESAEYLLFDGQNVTVLSTRLQVPLFLGHSQSAILVFSKPLDRNLNSSTKHVAVIEASSPR